MEGVDPPLILFLPMKGSEHNEVVELTEQEVVYAKGYEVGDDNPPSVERVGYDC